VYLGSQRSVLAVVILLAIASGEGGAVLVRELIVGCAVLAGGEEYGSACQGEGERSGSTSEMDERGVARVLL